MLKIDVLMKIVKLFHYNDEFQHLLKHGLSLKLMDGANQSYEGRGCLAALPEILRIDKNAVDCLSGSSTALRSSPYGAVSVSAARRSCASRGVT
jgi:hypothetical protein